MSWNWKEIKNEIKKRREGLVIGALVGFAASAYLVSQGQDWVAVMDTGKGLIDAVFTRSSAADLAVYKIYGTGIFLGAFIGYVFDWVLDLVWRKRRRR